VTDDALPRGVASEALDPVRVHFDGACQPPSGRGIAGYGFVVDGFGRRHRESGMAVPPHHEHATNNVAEYVAAIRALEWLRAQGYRGPVEVIGDSELVVRQMQGAYRVRAAHLAPYHEHLRRLAGGFSSVTFRAVPREENTEADALSKQAIETVRRREREDRR
jgi:ribonuclease HI